MNTPRSWSSREEAVLLLNAYFDNELDAASALEVERRLASDASLKAEYDRMSALRTALRAAHGETRAPDDLRRRIAAIANAEAAGTTAVVPMRTKPASRYAWRQMAAAASLAAVVTSIGMLGAGLGPWNDTQLAEIVAGHQRALLAREPFDVASSDRHTVKPWFDSKLALSPKIVDLGEAGFPLVGGRVDVVGGKAVPVSVYKRREHLISLMAIPHASASDDGSGAKPSTRDGYAVRSWRGRDFDYSAVSDVAEHELDEFVARWRAGAKAN